jgi:hypothetical protein
MKYHKLILISLIVLSALVLVFTGCSEKSLKGKLVTSQPPSIFWAQVPNDSLNHSNPVLHWYSTDMDGVVLDYRYSVLLTSTVDSLGGVSAVLNNFPADAHWTIIHTDSATIPMYASTDTSIFVDQYIFIKAMDEDSLYSGIIWKHLARNNHPPTCYVIVPRTIDGTAPEPQWCLPETTSTWKGIRVAWVGRDSIDIPGSIQPDFDWNIRIYGPFADSTHADTTGDYRYFTAAGDSTNVWIRTKQMYLTNLETGWYILYARNRDDAYTPSIPALGYLSIYEPTWIRHPELTKPILIANHSYYGPNGTFAALARGEIRVAQRDSVRNYYIQLLEQAGYTSADYDWVDFISGSSALPVPKSALYNHKMVIILDTDFNYALDNDAQETPYSLYMDVGGMIWDIGRRSFDASSGGLLEFGPSGDREKKHAIAYNYFNLGAVYSQPINYAQAEFAGASSLIQGFPDLSVDTIKVKACSWARIKIDPPHPPETTYFNYSQALIGVDNVIRRNDNSESIYKYRAINPDTSRFQDFPVAVRFDRGTFKTAYFAFPLYFIQRDQAQSAMIEMLAWFNPRHY